MSVPFANHWFLTGPTASGKTAVGIELARTLNAEIVSLDSMALYRGMDIGTAKPSAAERAEIPHHLIDVVDPTDEYSLADYLEASRQTCDAITERGRQVLFVGGTPLYLKALLRGVFSGPPADWELRNRYQAIATEKGIERLHAMLTEVDPQSAARLHPQDTRRIIRALEVFEKTGESITQLQQQFQNAPAAEDCRVFVLDWPREKLVERIDRRVDAMFAEGWVEEVQRLNANGKPLSRTALQAVGYREIMEYLRGERSLAETIEIVRIRTRQFSKRQMTWFRSLSECRFISMSEPFDAVRIASDVFANASFPRP